MDVSIIYGFIAYGLMSYCSYICMASFRIWFYSVYGFVVYGAMLYTADTVGIPICCMLRIIIISFCRFRKLVLQQAVCLIMRDGPK